jgi:hypothetical protein
MEWAVEALREFGLANVIVIAIGAFLGVLVWPFFVKEMWPEIKLGWQYKRTAAAAQSEKLSAFYDVLLHINTESINAHAKTVAELREMRTALEESIRIIEEQANLRHDELMTKIVMQIEAVNSLVGQWQRLNMPPFVETPGYTGYERRRPPTESAG